MCRLYALFKHGNELNLLLCEINADKIRELVGKAKQKNLGFWVTYTWGALKTHICNCLGCAEKLTSVVRYLKIA